MHSRSFRPVGLPIYVARVPSAPFASRGFNIQLSVRVYAKAASKVRSSALPRCRHRFCSERSDWISARETLQYGRTNALTQGYAAIFVSLREVRTDMFGRLKARRSIYGALVVAALSGCSTAYYAHTKEGKFWGATCLEWRNQHEFAFHQNSRHPFYFERANGEKIIPKSIYTDGGSIPRALWAFRGYSPWEYGPAFIIHDWLFIAHHCHDIGYERYDVDEAADIMSECIKTLMETNPKIVERSPGRMYRMNLAVRSFVAKRLWQDGDCPPQPPEIVAEQRAQSQRELRRRAPASRPMKVEPKKIPAETKAPLHEQVLDKLIQTVPVP